LNRRAIRNRLMGWDAVSKSRSKQAIDDLNKQKENYYAEF